MLFDQTLTPEALEAHRVTVLPGDALELRGQRGPPVVPENEAVVRRFMTELWSEGNLSVADELVAADHVHRVGDEVLRGPDEIRGAVSGLRTAFPDVCFDIDDVVSDGDRVVVRWTATGTHEETFAEVAPTGRRVVWIGCDWFRLRAGRLIEAFVVVDGGALYEQLTSTGT